jgi:hypothetical protein
MVISGGHNITFAKRPRRGKNSAVTPKNRSLQAVGQDDAEA